MKKEACMKIVTKGFELLVKETSEFRYSVDFLNEKGEHTGNLIKGIKFYGKDLDWFVKIIEKSLKEGIIIGKNSGKKLKEFILREHRKQNNEFEKGKKLVFDEDDFFNEEESYFNEFEIAIEEEIEEELQEIYDENKDVLEYDDYEKKYLDEDLHYSLDKKQKDRMINNIHTLHLYEVEFREELEEFFGKDLYTLFLKIIIPKDRIYKNKSANYCIAWGKLGEILGLEDDDHIWKVFKLLIGLGIIGGEHQISRSLKFLKENFSETSRGSILYKGSGITSKEDGVEKIKEVIRENTEIKYFKDLK